MAIDFPSYTGGAAVFNSAPSTNLAIQLYQKKLAREQAFDDYERTRLDRINEKGVRDVDREGLDNRVLELKGFYNANKDLIRRGNTPQAYDYEKRIRDVSSYINASKERTAKADAANKLRQERLKTNRMMDDDFWQEYQVNEKAIDEDGSRTLDLTKWMSTPPKYDPAVAIKGFADIKRTAGLPVYADIKGEPFKKTETITEVFDDNAKTAIAVRAQNLYDSNDGFAVHVQEQIKDPIQRGRLEKVFIEEFKTTPQSERDYAVASMMEQLQPSVTKIKTIEDWKDKVDYMQRYKERNIALNKSGQSQSPLTTGNEFDRISLKVYGEPQDGNIDAVTSKTLPASIPAILKSSGIDISDSRDFKVEISGGQIQSITPNQGRNKGKTIYRIDMENAQKKWNSEPQKGQQPAFGAPLPDTPKPKIDNAKPTPSKKEIKRSDIKSKASAAGYSEREYENLLKKNGVKIID